MGQAGFYILHDDDELNVPGLPQGPCDIPLALNSKRYNQDGTLWSPKANNERTSLYGDVIHVNGQPWPYLSVEPRAYRFRLLNAAVSRTYALSLEDAGKTSVKLPFTVVGSDTGLNLNAVDTKILYCSMAERWQVIIDFTKYAGRNITTKNATDVGADEDYIATDRIMQFRVANSASSRQQGTLPSTLRSVKFPSSKTGVNRTYKLGRTKGKWQVNGMSWSDGPEARVIAKPARGAVEVWELINDSGGWTHPIHIHLIDFQVMSRSGGERAAVMLYEKVALKDVVWLGRGETVRVIARYAPWDGLYMLHCHNLIHEDHEMMAAMNVTSLADFGYPETTRFLDPMDEAYRAKTYPPASGTVQDKLAWFAGLDAYREEKVEQALVQYWDDKPKPKWTSKVKRWSA